MPNREWGDGANRRSPHVIERASFAQERIGCRCGTMVLRGGHLSLEIAWDLHRGMRIDRPTVHHAQALATDSEVAEFLARLGNPYHPIRMSLRSHHSYTPTGHDSLEDAMDLLTRLQAAGEQCTCATTPVEECPNYTEADRRAA